MAWGAGIIVLDDRPSRHFPSKVDEIITGHRMDVMIAVS